MFDVFIRAFAFVFIIALGYLLKRVGFFGPQDYQLIARITLNITLPAAVITSFAQFQPDSSLFLLVLLAFASNVVMYLTGYWLSRKRSPGMQAFYTLNLPGHNIGAFTLPFAQSFMGPFGVVATCMFDIGNSIMCTGGSYALTSGRLEGGKNGLRPGVILRRLASSIPFCTYMLMLILVMLGIHIPSAVEQITSVIASGNSFMAMLMIGTMFELKFEPGTLKDAVKVLSIRYGFAAALFFLFYFVLPLSLPLRQVLAIVVFAPCSAMAPAFTEKCSGSVQLASFVNSMTILGSTLIITALILILGIG